MSSVVKSVVIIAIEEVLNVMYMGRAHSQGNVRDASVEFCVVTV